MRALAKGEYDLPLRVEFVQCSNADEDKILSYLELQQINPINVVEFLKDCRLHAVIEPAAT